MGFGWLLLSLACNYPTRAVEPASVPIPNLKVTLFPSETPTLGRPPSGTQAPTQPAAAGSFPGLKTATPAFLSNGPPPSPGHNPEEFAYFTQTGDTLPGLVGRFETEIWQISSLEPLSETGYLPPGLLITIPNLVGEIPYPDALLPDSEVIFSPSTVDFDGEIYTQNAGGYLSNYRETIGEDTLSGAEIVTRVAIETSANPRLLLAFLEYRSGWVLGQPNDPDQTTYPIGFFVPGYSGLYKELTLAANHLNIPFYDWRIGRRTYPDLQGGANGTDQPSAECWLGCGADPIFKIL